jgi:hypothetical protein
MLVNYKLIRASHPEDFTRPYIRQFPLKTDKAVPFGDIGVLRSHVFYLFKNLGPLRVAIQEKAMYATGPNHWLPVWMGQDEAYKAEVEQWLIYNWYPICNVLGEEFDFQTTLFLLSVNLDVWGEFFIYLTESEDSEPGAEDGGYPMLQIIWVYQVAQPRAHGALNKDNVLTGLAFGGKYVGYKCEMGVVKNKQGRAIAYSVLMDDPADDDLIAANDMIRVREMDMGDETRATPTSAHGIDQGRSILSLLSNEQDFLENASRINLLEYNDLAGLDPTDPQNRLSLMANGSAIADTANQEQQTNPPSITGKRSTTLEWMERSQIKYLNPKNGNKLEAFQFNRPPNEWHQFMDKLSRFLIDPIWPFYLVDREGDLGGAQARGLLARANRIIQDRQSLIRRVARRCVQYAVAKATKIGRIPANEAWWMWNFTLPQRITVDFGRDSKAEVMEVQNDLMDAAETVEARGVGPYELYLERLYRHKALKIKIKAQVEQEMGVEIPDEPTQPVAAGGGFGSSGSGPDKEEPVD